MVLYERRVEKDKDGEQIDKATLKNLKKKFVGEALRDIKKELTETECKFFDGLLEVATDRVLTRREAKQEKQELGNGSVDAECSEINQ